MANLYWPRREDLRSRAAHQRLFRRRLAAAERQARKVLLISHGECLDGAGSTIVTLRALDGVGVMTCQPSHVQDALAGLRDVPAAGRTLMVADLSLNPDHYEEVVAHCKALHAQGWRIEWRDHHHKQWEGLPLDRLLAHVDVLEVNDDATESGASLQQKAVAPKDRFARRLADAIKDRDLWWNKDEAGAILEAAMNHLGEQDFIAHFVPKKAKDDVLDETIRAAADAEQARVQHATRRLLSEARMHPAGAEKVAVIYGWLPKNVGLHEILQKDGVMVAINVRPNGHMSLRSRKGADVCQLVAREFDGGGHPNASGGTLGLSGARYWWYVLRRGRVGRVRKLARRAVHHLEARRL